MLQSSAFHIQVNTQMLIEASAHAANKCEVVFRRGTRILFLSAAVVLLTLIYSATALSEILVIGSSSGGIGPYKIGDLLSDDHLFDIPDTNCRILVLFYNHKFFQLRGPFNGILAEYKPKIRCSPASPNERQILYRAYFINLCAKKKACTEECILIYKNYIKNEDVGFKCD